MMSETQFKARCKKLGIAYSIRLWNDYVDACWSKIEEEFHLPIDKIKARE